jgi:hypothetical protein
VKAPLPSSRFQGLKLAFRVLPTGGGTRETETLTASLLMSRPLICVQSSQRQMPKHAGEATSSEQPVQRWKQTTRPASKRGRKTEEETEGIPESTGNFSQGEGLQGLRYCGGRHTLSPCINIMCVTDIEIPLSRQHIIETDC